MGNSETKVTAGVKAQAEGMKCSLYDLINTTGGGELVDLTKAAMKTRNYQELDDVIREKVTPYLYNNGEGRLVPIQEVVLIRNAERPKSKSVSKYKYTLSQAKRRV